MTRVSDFTELAKQGGVVLDWRHRLIAPDGTIAASTDGEDGGIHWGASLAPLDFDVRGASNRLTTLAVPATDPALVPGDSGPLHPNDNYRVAIDAGLVIDGETTWQRQATMLVNDALADDRAVVTMNVDLVDPTLPVRANMTTGFQFAEGDLVSDVVDRLLGQVLDRYTVAPSQHVVPLGSIGAGASRGQFVDQLLLGIGHELTSTPEGLVITRPILPTADDPGAEPWSYGGADGIPIARAQRSWTARSPQAWHIEGGAFTDANPPIAVTVYDLDPTSAGYFSGGNIANIPSTRASFVTSRHQAADAGYAQLRRSGVGPMSVSIWSVPNPGIRQGDIVNLDRPSINAVGRFRVVGYSLPLQNETLMRIDLRKTYDPALGFVPPTDHQDGCHVSFSDDFDRPNEDLQVTDGSGSPDWTEFGFSWGVEGQAAIQRFADGYSMALVNRPLCSSSQFAEIVVGQLPPGRRIGPVVRSGGQFDGYAFMASSDGSVAIERWLNGSRAATLAQASYGSVVGSTMRLQSIGLDLVASVDGLTVLTASDDGASGSHIGMLGFGGSSPNGPTATSFVAGAASA